MVSFKQNKHSVMESLPTDLLPQIFSRLSCKDVVVCKCVCRAWYNVLSHPNFSRHYAENPPFTSVFLFKHRCFDKTSYAFLLEIAADGCLMKTPLPTNIPNFHLNPQLSATEIHESYIIGMCKGLLFFCQSRRAFGSCDEFQRVYCHNLFSRECVLVARREWSRGHEFWPVEYRVDYISSTGKIKLLAFVNDHTQPAYILTVGIDRKWRRLEGPLDHFTLHGVCLNGVYYWIHGDTYPTYLKTFDFGKEKIASEWNLPRDLAQGTLLLKLAVLNNRISVIENLDSFDLVIWTIEEYGESWSKKTVIGDYSLHYLKATLTKGDLLFFNARGDGFKVVNLEKDNTTVKLYSCTTNSGILYASEFAPMFFSLKNFQNI